MTHTLRGKWSTSMLLLWLAIGLRQAGEGLWIYAKAGLAQVLLERAWRRAVADEETPKAWPWADTWPVARLKNERLGVDLIVLAGAGGHALAFGPAHVTGTAPPGTHGTTVITGHRDTHFAFLRKLRPGDFLSIDTPDGRTSGYVVRDTAVIDSRTGAIASDGIQRLALITCYPFDAIRPGGPWRFVVIAEVRNVRDATLIEPLPGRHTRGFPSLTLLAPVYMENSLAGSFPHRRRGNLFSTKEDHPCAKPIHSWCLC